MIGYMALAAAVLCALAFLWRRKPYSKTVAYCPHCASNLVRKEVAGRMRIACNKCNFVHWDNPKPVTATLVICEDGIVLVQRGVAPAAGDWCLPCGFVEHGENPAESAVREVEEESGLKVEIKALVCARVPRAGVNEIILFYIAVPVGGTLKAGDDATDARIFRPDALPSNIAFSTHRKLIDLWWERKLPQFGGLVNLD
jgi:8-oxo-dGTP diphosphatase